jgi:hypothetical protein
MRCFGLEVTNVCSPSAKFSWVGWLLSKIYSELLQDAKPITELLKKGNKYVWGEACDEAFHTFKKLLTTSPMLAQPDIAKPFNVYCDASSTGLGCVLMKEGRVISYSS